MATTKVKLTGAKVRAMAQDPAMQTLVEAVIKAKAFARVMTDLVTKKQREVLKFWQFQPAKKYRDRWDGTPEIILNPDHSYLLGEEDQAMYQREMQRFYREANLPTQAPGNCPMLEAQYLERVASRALAEYMEVYTGLNPDKIILAGREKFSAYIDLGIRAVISLKKIPA